MWRALFLSIATFSAACAPRIARLPDSLPASVQLNTASLGRVWVAGFVTTPSEELDINAEAVRLIRTELRNVTPAFVVDGSPVSVDSEQRLSDVPYWRTLGEEHG